jgi:hypothetical protein
MHRPMPYEVVPKCHKHGILLLQFTTTVAFQKFKTPLYLRSTSHRMVITSAAGGLTAPDSATVSYA